MAAIGRMLSRVPIKIIRPSHDSAALGRRIIGARQQHPNGADKAPASGVCLDAKARRGDDAKQ